MFTVRAESLVGKMSSQHPAGAESLSSWLTLPLFSPLLFIEFLQSFQLMDHQKKPSWLAGSTFPPSWHGSSEHYSHSCIKLEASPALLGEGLDPGQSQEPHVPSNTASPTPSQLFLPLGALWGEALVWRLNMSQQLPRWPRRPQASCLISKIGKIPSSKGISSCQWWSPHSCRDLKA